MVPQRIQRKRTKGWKMPPNTVYVGRPTVFGNPFVVGTREECVDLYRRGIVAARAAWFGGPESIFSAENAALYAAWEGSAPHLQASFIEGRLDELSGKNLACWCPLDKPCHADVLLELANSCATPPAVLPGDRRSAARSFPGSGPHPMGDA